MPGDELPMYPTPQQSAYIVGSSSPHTAHRHAAHARSHENMRQAPPPMPKTQYVPVQTQPALNTTPYGTQGYQETFSQPVHTMQQQFHQHQKYDSPSAMPQQNTVRQGQYYQGQIQAPSGQVQPVYYQPALAPASYQPQVVRSSQDGHPYQVQEHRKAESSGISTDQASAKQQQKAHYVPQQYANRLSNNLHKRPLPPQPLQGNHTNSSTESFHLPHAQGESSKVKESAKSMSSKQKLENELHAVFSTVDVNKSGKISAYELSRALTNFDNTRFQESTVNLMVKLFSGNDGNSSSSQSLNFEQFVSLWKYLSAYKKLFVAADLDKSGDISFGEFQKILEQIGYKLNIDLILFLFQKFAYKNESFDARNSVIKLKFDSFIELLVYLRKLTDIFKKYDKDLSGVATISFLDFLFEISSLP